MPGSAVVMTKEEMNHSWEEKVYKTRVHHAKMHSRIRKMQSEYQRNLDEFDLEHRRRMEAAEKRRTALMEQRARGGNGKCTTACVQRKKTKKLRKKSVDAACFNRKRLNRQLSQSASDIPKIKHQVAEVATSPGCVCCGDGDSDDDNEDAVQHVSSTSITLTPRKRSESTVVQDAKVDVKPEIESKKQSKASDGSDDENMFVRFLGWVGIMKEKAFKDGGKGKGETPAPDVAATATFKDAPVSAKIGGVTPSRNVLEPNKTVLYVNITPTTGKLSPRAASDANNATTPKSTSDIDLKMYRGYVKDTAAKFLAISGAQNAATSPVTPKATPEVVVLPAKDHGQKIAVSVVQADRIPAAAPTRITGGDSKTEIKIVINQL